MILNYLNKTGAKHALLAFLLFTLSYNPVYAQSPTVEINCKGQLEDLSPRQKEADSLIVRIAGMMKANDPGYQCFLPFYIENYVGPGKEKSSQYYYNLMANTQFRKGNYDSVRYYLADALRCDSILGDSFLMSTDIGIKANLLLSEGKTDEAIEQYKLSLSYLNAEEKPMNANAMLTNLGVAYLRKGYTETALQHYLKALEYDKKRSNVYGIESGLILKINIGIILKRQKKYSESLQNLLSVEDTLRALKVENPYISYLTFVNLASCYFDQDSLQKAAHYVDLAENKVNEAGFDPSRILSWRVSLAQKRNDLREMKQYLDQLAAYFDEKKSEPDLEYIFDLGQFYSLSGKKQAAIRAWEPALKELQADSTSNIKLDLLQAVGQTFMETGNFTKAAQYLKQAIKHNEIIEENNRVTTINDMLTSYEVRNYQAQIERNKVEKALLLSRQKIDRLILGLAAALIILLLTGFAFFRRTSLLREQHLQTEKWFLEKEAQQKNKELEFQKQQLLNRNLQLAQLKNNVLDLCQRDISDKKLFQRKIHMTLNETSLGEYFFNDFNLFYPGFNKKLTQKYPEISNRQLQYCMLIALGLSNKEIADILFVSESSVEKSRFRLAERFQLTETSKLSPMLRNFLLENIEA